MVRSSGKGPDVGCCSGPLIPIWREGVAERFSIHYQMGTLAAAVVHPGDRVAAFQVLATLPRPRYRHVVDVAQALGLSPTDVSQAMTKTPGDTVAQGEVMAAATGPLPFFHKLCRAPVSGVLAQVVEGWAVIDLEQTEGALTVNAVLPGRIGSVGSGGGSIIVDTEAVVFDVAMVLGTEVAGPLRIVCRAESADDVPPDGLGTILVANGATSQEFICRAAEVGVAAIVMGSIDALLPGIVDQRNLPALVVLQGYGHVPMSSGAFTLLSALDGTPAAITNRIGRAAADRSVLAVSLDENDTRIEPKLTAGSIRRDVVVGVGPGDYVRAVRQPIAGVGGVVESVLPQPVKTHSGYALDGAVLRCDEPDASGEAGAVDRIRVPWLNLERIVRGGMVSMPSTSSQLSENG